MMMPRSFSQLQVSHHLSRSISDSQQEKQNSALHSSVSPAHFSRQNRDGHEENGRLVPPAFCWQHGSWTWPGMAPQCQEHHCQLIPELQVRNNDQIILKGIPEVGFSISFSSLEAAVSASSEITFGLWEQNIPNPSAQSSR